ncbi:MAG: carboxymuconolactone decarboxylase family protein [Bacteroidales bacterium]|nr:carboxymuconolactone decarboxylase family protein [Bacteroidales bacterium]
MNISAQTLSERQLLLCACASLEAQGDIGRLDPAIRRALDGGLTINELKEAFSQLYAYTGFPRSLNALGTLQKVLADRKVQGINDNEGKPFARPAVWSDAKQALLQGTQVQTRLTGKPFDFDFCPQDDYYLKSHLFGDIFAGDGLSAADRELVTVAALSSLKGVEPQLAAHKAGAVNMGNTKEQVDELCRWLSSHGYSQVDSAADANAGAWPKGNPNDAYAQFFIGNSHLAPVLPANLAAGTATVAHYANVTFEPGCRNSWHIHHGAHQILICVSGRGWYQEWGKQATPLMPGIIIDIPAEVKHWHGAQKDCWFQHLTTHVATGGEQSNEWLEPVTDEQYSKASRSLSNIWTIP